VKPNTLKISKNDYEKFLQLKKMSHHQSSTFFENIDQIIESNDFFKLKNKSFYNEWKRYLVFIKDPLNVNLLMNDILKNEN
jgi:predicted nucleotidyltransferase